jgi:hypothetical protein
MVETRHGKWSHTFSFLDVTSSHLPVTDMVNRLADTAAWPPTALTLQPHSPSRQPGERHMNLSDRSQDPHAMSSLLWKLLTNKVEQNLTSNKILRASAARVITSRIMAVLTITESLLSGISKRKECFPDPFIITSLMQETREVHNFIIVGG